MHGSALPRYLYHPSNLIRVAHFWLLADLMGSGGTAYMPTAGTAHHPPKSP